MHGGYKLKFKKTMFALAIGSIAIIQSTGAHAVGANYFSFNGGSDALGDGGLTAPATGSWFTLVAQGTSFGYTPIRAAGTSGADLSPGNLNFNAAETITFGSAGLHNTGNSIDRDWTFLGAHGAHFTNQALEVNWDGVSHTATVDMDG